MINGHLYRLSKLVYRLTTDSALAEAFKRDPESVLQSAEIAPELTEAVRRGDLLMLYRRGLHPLLLVQLSLMLGIDIQHYYESQSTSEVEVTSNARRED